MDLDRRSLLAGAAALSVVPSALFAQSSRPPVGLIGALVNRNGLAKLTLEGSTSLATSEPLTADHRWHIGSNTKAMTAALYARLVDQGKLRWKATIPQLFPHLSLHPDWAETTVEQVMGHVAGVSDLLIDGPWLRARHQDRRPITVQRAEFAQSVLSQPPQASAGTFSYGNAGSILLGAAIEHATRRSWEANMEARVFKPIGMRSSGFGAPPVGGPWGHQATATGPLPMDPRGIADNPKILGPAGRVHLSLGDYGRFLSVFLREGQPLLSKKSFRQLLTPPTEGGTYAGGWGLQKGRSGAINVLVHEGSNTFWHAIAAVYLDEGIAVTAIANEAGAQARSAALAMMMRVRPPK
jgi:CubicO group peptidase (beta-lactamase class C family)